MADGRVGLPSSSDSSACWPGRLQPTVELDVPKSTPHAEEIMEFKGLGQNGAQVYPARAGSLLARPALVRRGARPAVLAAPLLLLAALFKLAQALRHAGLHLRVGHCGAVRDPAAAFVLGPAGRGIADRRRRLRPGLARDGDAQRRGRREAAVLERTLGYWNSWLAGAAVCACARPAVQATANRKAETMVFFMATSREIRRRPRPTMRPAGLRAGLW